MPQRAIDVVRQLVSEAHRTGEIAVVGRTPLLGVLVNELAGKTGTVPASGVDQLRTCIRKA